MNIDLGQLSTPDLVMGAGAAVVIFGLLAWFAPSHIGITVFGTTRVWLPGSARAGQAIVAFGSLILATGLLAQVWPGAPASSPLAGGRSGGGIHQPPPSASPGDPSPSPGPLAADASGSWVKITTPGGSATLGRDVVASGAVGARRYNCFAIGWHVETTDQWSAYYFVRLVSPAANGTFRTPTMTMGSPGETGSSWWPYLLGGTSAGCSWLHQLWARTPTGEYRDSFPPPGITTLYYAHKAIHRTT